ncbi:hypothetical protein O0I10_002244 [Lichtheimia ornata]|uniref:GSKIP domain-containing protein n=1 Tax=Lichtheimia ornata TaxID=688661 RepID=A0AAD7Y229_9FUNG|nr:uncharacterized protein O0I10_002244 [Lichtheimia ornata]KAJ8661913.1 hypothetical protein O0I10_002244 [Lichtheimia ornata]
MRLPTLSEELDAITHNYDYGIVPGSATVFVHDELEGIGRLDLTLLEGVMIVIEVGDQGYKITSYSPLYSTSDTVAATQSVVANLNRPFETMESLLMTISPMFSQRFQELLYQKLDDLREQQQQQQPSNDDNDALLQQQQPTPSSYNTLSEQEGL